MNTMNTLKNEALDSTTKVVERVLSDLQKKVRAKDTTDLTYRYDSRGEAYPSEPRKGERCYKCYYKPKHMASTVSWLETLIANLLTTELASEDIPELKKHGLVVYEDVPRNDDGDIIRWEHPYRYWVCLNVMAD